MVTVLYHRGVHLPAAGLWLDPRDLRELAFVSHAHSDHTARHRQTLCTPATARLMQVRMGGTFDGFLTPAYWEKTAVPGGSATLLPAGHVLGSAQMFFESDEGTLLYTGDFKVRTGLSAEPVACRHADTLVMETTYGLPRYLFPPADEVLARLVKFCHEALEEGDTPVLLGYALGKAQEILAALRGTGLPIMLHGAVEKLTRVYEEFGVIFPPHMPCDPANLAGHVVICPPSVNGSRFLARIKNRRVAAVTGWALDPGAIHRLQVDTAFPLSDHAGYDDLLHHVEAVQPRRILTLHGFAAEFARDLRARGWEAWALTAPDQLEFSLIPPSLTLRPRPASKPEPGPVLPGFSAFCQVAETIRTFTGKREKIRLLAEYFQGLDNTDLPLAARWLTGRAAGPDTPGPSGVGSAVIRQALGRAAGLSQAALRAISRKNNDSGLTTSEVLTGRDGTESPPLAEIANTFCALGAARGPLTRSDLLAAIFRRVPALAAGYLVRILTGDLRIGLKEGLVEEAVAVAFAAEPEAVRTAHMLLGDLGRTALLARQGRLETAELTLFRPVKVMLAGPAPDANAVWERLGSNGSVWLEDKLDGIRAQIHCSPERAEIFSRDLKPLTATFPEIAMAAASLGRDAVFDAEILAWHGDRSGSFFDLQKRLGRREPDLFLDREIPVAAVVFDLLQLDGDSLLNLPLSERRTRLETVSLPPPLRLAGYTRAENPQAIDTAFSAARERGNEGLMAKDPSSAYTPGRRGMAWIKLKKDFDTLDVVVVAAEYGHGRRSKVLSDYTFAVRDETNRKLLPIGKAYSGLTDGEIADLTRTFLTLEVSRRGNRLEVKPLVVLEVTFDSIQPSSRHAAGLSLRFPRIKRIRSDKQVQEIDSLATARQLAGIWS